MRLLLLALLSVLLCACGEESSAPSAPSAPRAPSAPSAPRAPRAPSAPRAVLPPEDERELARRAALAAIRATAKKAADELRTRGRGYDRDVVREFQRAAGIVVDGLYGGGTAGALRYWLGSSPPRPLYKPLAEKVYSP